MRFAFEHGSPPGEASVRLVSGELRCTGRMMAKPVVGSRNGGGRRVVGCSSPGNIKEARCGHDRWKDVISPDCNRKQKEQRLEMRRL